MARKSRKNTEVTFAVKFEENNAEIIPSEKIYKTAIYARLSSEDISDGGAVENQILLVQKYIESKPYLKLWETFIDNGKTGTNFERGGFESLMDAAKSGKIDCIAVKDLSRFGRNYIETGNYLEEVFPFLGVRFISVNDNYDSYDLPRSNDNINSSNLTVILKNLINDIYARDISKKCRTALQIKQQRGEFIGNTAPYGYMKSPDNKNKITVDAETAPIVRDIFRWKSDGMSAPAIVGKLNAAGVLSPSNYLYSKGLLFHEKYAKKILWNASIVRKILANPAYIGHMAQGKKKSSFGSGRKEKCQTINKWIVVENTHEPIIEPAIFNAVRR
ncbi:MAG: recombinase family protein [Oscillospiraceae bacterium]|nr:recombinase family protein [Oscillospiraceae bacterium]